MFRSPALRSFQVYNSLVRRQILVVAHWFQNSSSFSSDNSTCTLVARNPSLTLTYREHGRWWPRTWRCGIGSDTDVHYPCCRYCIVAPLDQALHLQGCWGRRCICCHFNGEHFSKVSVFERLADRCRSSQLHRPSQSVVKVEHHYSKLPRNPRADIAKSSTACHNMWPLLPITRCSGRRYGSGTQFGSIKQLCLLPRCRFCYSGWSIPSPN
jgi:hypothetical protein